jgi:hypothetical protein
MSDEYQEENYHPASCMESERLGEESFFTTVSAKRNGENAYFLREIY